MELPEAQTPNVAVAWSVTAGSNYLLAGDVGDWHTVLYKRAQFADQSFNVAFTPDAGYNANVSSFDIVTYTGTAGSSGYWNYRHHQGFGYQLRYWNTMAVADGGNGGPLTVGVNGLVPAGDTAVLQVEMGKVAGSDGENVGYDNITFSHIMAPNRVRLLCWLRA